MRIGHYFWKLLIAIDQLGNAALDGEPDETLSSRMGRSSSKIAEVGCEVLDVIDKEHCHDSIEFTPEGSPDPHHLSGIERK